MGDYTSVKFEDLAKGELRDDIVEYNFICLECKQNIACDQKLTIVATAVGHKAELMSYNKANKVVPDLWPSSGRACQRAAYFCVMRSVRLDVPT